MKNIYKWIAIMLAGALCIAQFPGSAVFAASGIGTGLSAQTQVSAQTLEGMTEEDEDLSAEKETESADGNTTGSESTSEPVSTTESETSPETPSETETLSETESVSETETSSETESASETETSSETETAAYQALLTIVLRETDGSESRSQSTVTSEEGVFQIALSGLDGYVLTGWESEAALTESDGVLSGDASADIDVTLLYEADRIGEADPEAGDGIPDRYQVTFSYETDGNGRILSGAKEVVTRYAPNGSYSETAKVSPRGEVKVRGAVSYELAGWIGSDDNLYLSLEELKAASFDGDTTFTAVFFITYYDYSYSIEYYYNEVLGDTSGWILAALNQEITEYSDRCPEGFALDRVENFPLVIGESDENVIRVYYSTDEIGGEDYDTPDGIPDKYQVTFRYETGEYGVLTGTLREVVTRGSAADGYSADAAVSPAAQVKLSLADGYRLAYWETSAADVNGETRFDSLKALRSAEFTDSDITVTAVLEEIPEDPTEPEEPTEPTSPEEPTEPAVPETTEETEESTEENSEESTEETTTEVSYELTTMGDQQTPLGSGFLSPESDARSYEILFALTVLAMLVGTILTCKRERHIRKLKKMLEEEQKK